MQERHDPWAVPVKLHNASAERLKKRWSLVPHGAAEKVSAAQSDAEAQPVRGHKGSQPIAASRLPAGRRVSEAAQHPRARTLQQ